MDIGATVAFSHRTPVDYIVGAAKLIEAAGFTSVWVPEHVLFFPNYTSRYPYAEDGRVPGDPDGVLDPFTALTFVAAHTSRLRLGTGICLVPQRNPIYTAKMVADLDYLSAGRVDFGIGIGWLAEEFGALGADFKARAARCNEYMAAMKALWTQAPASFAGETVSFEAVHFNPKPVQRPHPPIFVGGESEPALERVAQLADGWYGFDLAAEQVPGLLQRLDRHLADAGRNRNEITVLVCPNRHRVDEAAVDAYREAGVDQLILPLFARGLGDLEARITGAQRLTGLR
jgi:probable F420-dependent oxidoreductase